MKLIFAIEAGQPGGTFVRMVFGVSLTLPLVWMARIAGLF